MSRHNQAGFTLVELLVVISLVAVMIVTFGIFFTNYLLLYSKYQSDSLSFNQIGQQSQRISNVLRGATDIVALSGNSLTVYAYFSPVDAYVSQVKYYISADGKSVLADVTRMTANPPSGTLITSSKKTYTVVNNFYLPSGGTLFNYYDSTGTAMTLPISDQHTVLQIRVNLATTATHTSKGQTLSTVVSLRNRKTNL